MNNVLALSGLQLPTTGVLLLTGLDGLLDKNELLSLTFQMKLKR